MQQSVRALSRVDEVQARRDVAEGLVQVRLSVLNQPLDHGLGYTGGEQKRLHGEVSQRAVRSSARVRSERGKMKG